MLALCFRLVDINILYLKNPKKEISGKVAFRLYDTFGFPLELTEELGAENGFTVDKEGFKEAERKHQEASKSADAGAAKGGLAEQSEITTAYHTATHLLQQALVNVLGNQVAQKGSNITNERMRFDFTFERPMTKEEIQQVEDIVNEKIIWLTKNGIINKKINMQDKLRIIEIIDLL